MKKLCMIILTAVLCLSVTDVFAKTLKRRIVDSDGDELNINSDGKIPVSLDSTLTSDLTLADTTASLYTDNIREYTDNAGIAIEDDVTISSDLTISGTTSGLYLDGPLYGDLTISGTTAAIWGDSDNDVRILSGTDRGVNLQIEVSQPLNADLTFSGTNYLQCRTYMDDNFGDDEILPLSFNNETELFVNPGLNGTYETEATGIDIAPNWNNSGLDTGVDTASQEDTIVHTSGGQSQYINCDATGEGAGQSVTLTANKKYRIDAWVYVVSGTVRMVALENGGDSTVYGTGNNITDTGEWQLSIVEFEKEDDGSSMVCKVSSGSGAAEYYFDDASLTEITPTFGHGIVSCSGEHATFSWQEDGTTQVDGSTNVANSDADGNLCVYDGGYTPYIKNRIPSADRKMRATTWFK